MRVKLGRFINILLDLSTKEYKYPIRLFSNKIIYLIDGLAPLRNKNALIIKTFDKSGEIITVLQGSQYEVEHTDLIYLIFGE